MSTDGIELDLNLLCKGWEQEGKEIWELNVFRIYYIDVWKYPYIIQYHDHEYMTRGNIKNN